MLLKDKEFTNKSRFYIFDCFVYGLGYVLIVLFIEADHSHTTIVHHVNVVFVVEVVALIFSQT